MLRSIYINNPKTIPLIRDFWNKLNSRQHYLEKVILTYESGNHQVIKEQIQEQNRLREKPRLIQHSLLRSRIEVRNRDAQQPYLSSFQTSGS
ncbi:hypothetical protein D3C86_1549930 [compost metagenome]